jgi:hypothetical protein
LLKYSTTQFLLSGIVNNVGILPIIFYYKKKTHSSEAV